MSGLSPAAVTALWSAGFAAALQGGWDAYAYVKIRPGIVTTSAGSAVAGIALVDFFLSKPTMGENFVASALIGGVTGGMADEWKTGSVPASTAASAGAGTLLGSLVHKL